jgi:hypothetical protein
MILSLLVPHLYLGVGLVHAHIMVLAEFLSFLANEDFINASLPPLEPSFYSKARNLHDANTMVQVLCFDIIIVRSLNELGYFTVGGLVEPRNLNFVSIEGIPSPEVGLFPG